LELKIVDDLISLINSINSNYPININPQDEEYALGRLIIFMLIDYRKKNFPAEIYCSTVVDGSIPSASDSSTRSLPASNQSITNLSASKSLFAVENTQSSIDSNLMIYYIDRANEGITNYKLENGNSSVYKLLKNASTKLFKVRTRLGRHSVYSKSSEKDVVRSVVLIKQAINTLTNNNESDKAMDLYNAVSPLIGYAETISGVIELDQDTNDEPDEVNEEYYSSDEYIPDSTLWTGKGKKKVRFAPDRVPVVQYLSNQPLYSPQRLNAINQPHTPVIREIGTNEAFDDEIKKAIALSQQSHEIEENVRKTKRMNEILTDPDNAHVFEDFIPQMCAKDIIDSDTKLRHFFRDNEDRMRYYLSVANIYELCVKLVDLGYDSSSILEGLMLIVTTNYQSSYCYVPMKWLVNIATFIEKSAVRDNVIDVEENVENHLMDEFKSYIIIELTE
jgi:hypothetical protein